MKAQWVLHIDQLPQKDFKMFEEEAKELLKKYEQELEEAKASEEGAAFFMYSYSKRWNECYALCLQLREKIADLKGKIEDKEEDDE